jgi:Ca2+/H+ antiporter, TMEM165/GDT1 family
MPFLAAALPTFLASLVEAVEALTIVLAVGVTRQWRAAIYGVAAALAVLALLVVVFGTAIVLFVPIDALRVVIGALLLIYGLQWTCKSVLRASGAKALHDEERIYAEQVGRLAAERPVPVNGLDGVSFAVAFKGVLLEGLEVCFIVITFGSSAGELGAAVAGATLAVLVVVAAGLVLREPLARVPENALKFAVGMMLVTFGTFWAGEGIGIEWPLDDLAIPVLLAIYVAAGLCGTWLARAAFARRMARLRPAAPAN